MKMANLVICLICIVVLVGVCEGGELRKNFYQYSCPLAEQMIKEITESNVLSNPNLPAKLIRLHFHDCFVRGCDASILLEFDPAGNSSNTEKKSPPNRTVFGYEFIDDVKAQLEKECPGVVSCADIVTLATRDSVSFQFQESLWEVLTGRRDGSVSISSEALSQIPRPSQNFASLEQSFANKGLTVHDLVVLSGAHTIGVTHCNEFTKRLYNFTGIGDADPSLDPAYADVLRTMCPNIRSSTELVMDPLSPLKFDSNYYLLLKDNKGLFESDAALLTNEGSKNIVGDLLDENKFLVEFAESMKRMGAIGVLTGTSGQIRKNCKVVNPS